MSLTRSSYLGEKHRYYIDIGNPTKGYSLARLLNNLSSPVLVY